MACTAETAELAAIVLRDSAHLQEEDAAYANELGFSKHRPALPLYDLGDVEKTLPLITPAPMGQPRRLASRCVLTLAPAGHILGSATAALQIDGHRALFSGDLGRHRHPLLRPPAHPPGVDTIIVESTYGDRRHPRPDPSLLANAICRTVDRGGTVLIPAFAVDRTELVLLELHRLMRCGDIPQVPVFVDSPMALAALDVYRRALTSSSDQLRPELIGKPDIFDPGDLRATRTAEESKRLNRPTFPSIIISASGMAAGGRVVHHLAHQLPDHRNTVILTGFQAEGTRGRRLLEGAREVKIHGRYVPVKAEIVSVSDFSVHSDADETIAWLGRAPAAPQTVYVVHGEPQSAARLASRIQSELG